MKKALGKIFMFLGVFLSILCVTIGEASWVWDAEYTVNSASVSNTISTTTALCYNSSTGTQYTSISAALNSASANSTVYVYTGQSIDCETTLTIPSGVTLCLPFQGKAKSSDTTSPMYRLDSADNRDAYGGKAGDQSSSNVNLYRRILLNMREGADIVVNGTLQIGGVASVSGNNGYYSEINLGFGSSITVNGTLDCFGYIKESYDDYANPFQESNSGIINNSFDQDRYLLLNSGSVMNTFIATYDAGSHGRLGSLLTANQVPFWTFDLPASQTYTTINCGAKLNADILMVGPSGTAMSKPVTMITNNTSEESMFYMSSGSITMEYYPTDVRYTLRDYSAKTNIVFAGEATLGYLYYSVSMSGISATLDTRNCFLPVSCKMNMYIQSGAVFTMPYRMKFLLGSYMEVLQGGTFNVNNELIFHDAAGAVLSSDDASVLYSYDGGEDAQFIMNGTLALNTDGSGNAALGANIQHTTLVEGGAVLDFSLAPASTQFTVTSDEGYAGSSCSVITTGIMYNTPTNEIVNSNFTAPATYTSIFYDSQYCWAGAFATTHTLTVVVEDVSFAHSVYGYEIFQSSSESGETTSLGTSASSFNIDIGMYIKINVTRTRTYSLKDSSGTDVTSLVNGSLFLMDDDYTLTITPAEAVSLSFYYDIETGKTKWSSDGQAWNSGTGHFSWVVYESWNKNDSSSYYSVGQSTGMGSTSKPSTSVVYVAFGAYFKLQYVLTGTSPLMNYAANQDVKTETNLDGLSVENDSSYSFTNTVTCNPADMGLNGYSDPFTAGANYDLTAYWYYSQPCILAGSMISMADGSPKAVEDISLEDTVMSYSFFNGCYEEASVIYIERREEVERHVVTVFFDDGTYLETSGGQSYFDLETLEYFTIDSSDEEHIGKSVLAYEDGAVSSKTVTRIEEETRAVEVYDIITENNWNFVANGILTVIPEVFNLNIFEVGEDLKYDEELMEQDIAAYGLYTYDDFSAYVSYEQFTRYNVKYLKVAVGKGLITEEEMLSYFLGYKHHGIE